MCKLARNGADGVPKILVIGKLRGATPPGADQHIVVFHETFLVGGAEQEVKHHLQEF